MAQEPCREAGQAKGGALSSPVDEELGSSHLSPPAGTPAGRVGPECLKDTRASSPRGDLQSAAESLDPRTLRLLLGQRELEIRALRCALQKGRDARHCRILQEVAGVPLQRSTRSLDRLLLTQVQKLTLELKEQKKQAQLEKERLEEELLRTQAALQQREAELHALQRSCLRQLACSSWVGRMLRSSTGSVEVVPTEALIDPSDSSENEGGTPAQEGFRLEDVDWNTIAHRYPNLFANIKPSSDYRHPWPRTPPQPPAGSPPDQCGPELCRRRHRLRSVEWSSPPFGGPDNSRGANSDSSSRQLDECWGVQVTGNPPRSPGHISFQNIVAPARSFSRDSKAEPEGPPEQEISLDLGEAHSDRPGEAANAALWPPAHPWSPSKTGSCLKIVAVNHHEGFVCIFNESTEETVNLGGFVLQQFLRDIPVCMYRFPPDTLLEPRHHITVWGEGPGGTKKQLPSSEDRKPAHFHPSPSIVTLLLSPKGEIFSKYQAPHCAVPVSRIFDDNTDLSIDSFPLSETQPRADARKQRRPSRPPRNGRGREGVSVPLERAEADDAGKLLPAVPSERAWEAGREGRPARHLPSLSHAEGALGLVDCRARREPRIRVCRKSVDRGCPLVALSVQSMAESRFGFRFGGCPPIAADTDGCRPGSTGVCTRRPAA
ncbi:lamin tail domain-containing protein 2 [Pteronotus mesoamericanus]|uniref:lamin tail domain-containing protein 2 n=1 Tax=Pteronotus mesoamericanus TaxID=1884717 RepID=UPI0023EDFF3A|nr:lamin tail domain-containing protein 2 [Pteronotus parnellii mesoamericanus]